MSLKAIRGEYVNLPINATMGSEFIDPTERNRDRSYEKWLQSKALKPIISGLESVPTLHPQMFPHQHDVCHWALRLGRSAAFLGTGMGKTLIARKFRESRHDLTIEEINEDVVPLEQLWERNLCGCDRQLLEDMGVSL